MVEHGEIVASDVGVVEVIVGINDVVAGRRSG